MALQAGVLLALEPRMVGLLLRQTVEDASEHRIHRRDFHDRTTLHPPDVDIVIEVDRARRPGRDAIHLQTRAREHESLRRLRNVERVEHGRKIAVRLVERQLDFSGVDLLLQLGYRIGGSSLRVGNCLFGERRQLRGNNRGGQQRTTNREQRLERHTHGFTD